MGRLQRAAIARTADGKTGQKVSRYSLVRLYASMNKRGKNTDHELRTMRRSKETVKVGVQKGVGRGRALSDVEAPVQLST